MTGSLSMSRLTALIAECDDKETVMAVLAGFIAESGAKCGFLYSFKSGVKSAAEDWAPLFSSFPPAISEYYCAMSCVTEDPFMRAALASTAPIRFMEVEAALEPCAMIEDLYDLIRAHGLVDGLAMHISDRPGHVAYFCLAYDHSLENMSEFERRRIRAGIEMFMRHAGDILQLDDEQELSPKERAVIACLARGESNKKIARSLGVSTSTVNTLVSRSFEKLGVNNRTEAVIAACRTGLPLVA